MKYSAILYTDGGARPTNPGFAGWGVHGYVYKDEVPKTGAGHPDFVLTNQGYIRKSAFKPNDSLRQVTPVGYIDAHGGLDGICTNNAAEIVATIEGIKLLQGYQTQHHQPSKNDEFAQPTIHTDSKGVVTACNGLLGKWKSLGWKKTNGEPLANEELAKTLDFCLSSYRENANHPVTVQWIEAHCGHLGNESADQLATIGCVRRMNNDYSPKFTWQTPQGYWKNEVERHPLLIQKCLYMTTRQSDLVTGQYHLGAHGKDDAVAGKKQGDGYYCYLELNEPDAIIEMIRQKQCAVANADELSYCLLHLDVITSSKVYAQLQKHGLDCVYIRHQNTIDLYVTPKTPITKEQIPAYITARVFEETTVLQKVMRSVAAGDARLTITDLTLEFFEEKEVKGKKTLSLRPEFAQGVNSLDFFLNVEKSVDKQKVSFSLGADCPHRNALKKLETKKPKILGITWMESDQVWRYVTYVEVDDARAVYGAMYTNTRVLINKK